MCDSDDFEEVDQEEDEDYLDYDSAPVGRIKYRKADKPFSIEERLGYFKYDKQYHKSMNELMRYFCIDPTGKRKPKLLLLRIKDDSYVFVPREALYEQGITAVGWMGHTMHFPASAPTYTLTTTLYHSDERKLWAKYNALTEAVFKGEENRPLTICGMLFYISDMDAQFGTVKQARDTITIKFTAVTDYKYGYHMRLRQREHDIRKQFGKFVCKSNP